MAFRWEVIDFFDSTNRCVLHRKPTEGSTDITYGAQLIVQQNQEAVFYREGQAWDTFGPGHHTLVTDNVPLIARVLTLPWQKSPFQAAVYFVGKQTFTDQRWGTRQPIALRDKDFGMVRLRGFGLFSYRVQDSSVLINTMVGTQGRITTDEITAFLRDLIVTRLTDLLATIDAGILELPARLDEISAGARAKIADDFARYGLELVDFFVNSITPPDEVQKAIDAHSSGQVAGNLRDFTRQQTSPAAMQRPAKTEDARQLVQSVAQAAGWNWKDRADGTAEIVVPLGVTRRQRVRVDFARIDSEQNRLIHFHTACGPATPENALNYLRWNRQLAHGAFAVEPSDGGELVVIAANQLVETADNLEVSRLISAIAWQADQIEQQLLGQPDEN
ncbi:MAG: SPFH domain-containing protein [Planctomycetota bacterium]|nr:SPFH domain-containing protein [Planctomycetota bacterium]MDA1179135.1 SPFH domain-containing protein [Planctomycetota bacterium]